MKKHTIKFEKGKIGYREISSILIEYIQNANLRPGSKMPSVRYFAEYFGVSVRTVYRAIQLLNVKKICLQKPRSGIFVSNSELMEKRKRISAVGVFNEFGFSVTADFDCIPLTIFSGIQRKLAEENYQIIQFHDIDENSLEYYTIKNKIFDTLIILAESSIERFVKLANLFPKVNFLLVNYRYDDFLHTPKNFRGVFNDDEGGAYLMTNYLLSKYQSVVCLAYQIKNATYNFRLDGCARAICESGASQNCDVICLRSKKMELKWKSISEVFCDIGKKVDCFFLLDDNSLLYFNKINKKKGEVFLAGYDNYHAHNLKQIPMVFVDFYGMGYLAATLACDQNQDKITFINPKIVKN